MSRLPIRIRITAASVSEACYGGTPGRIFIREGKGIVIVAGTEARHGRSRGLVIERVRTEDGVEHDAMEYFPKMGGYLTTHP